ncbi:hypothetical protein [Elioraea rosea]|uniref:hypothetical protein n=1 Tax=Elioraea rosea TaxID=2492390 RepID=UPI001182EFEF|nr:hypothetical protein [Elioraea rosea]
MADPTKSPSSSREGLKSAYETCRQVITLATAIATLTVTFAKEFKPAGMAELSVPVALQLAWGLYGLAVFFGLWAMLAITGSHNALDKGTGTTDAMATNIRIPSLLMLLAFVLGFGATLAAGASIVR